MSYRDWKVGDKVICVDDEWTSGGLAKWGVPCPLRVGAIYTIAEIFTDDLGVYTRSYKAPINVTLAEVEKPHHPKVKPTNGFNAARFRPIQKRKTSIEVFERLLSPSDKDKHLIEVFDFVSMQGDLQ